MYAMNLNRFGYAGDLNPTSIAATQAETEKQVGDRLPAKEAAAIAKEIDPSRPVYHHESGNLGDLYTINTYLNWAPIQERGDWFALWEQHGEKPVFIVEWGLPHNASWSSHRSIPFIWRGPVVQCVWLNEYNAEFLGEKAYRRDGKKEELYRLHEQFCQKNSPVFFQKLNLLNFIEDAMKIRVKMASCLKEMRARGLSAYLPWDQSALWQPRRLRQGKWIYPGRFRNLKRPGPVPDMIYRGNTPLSDWSIDGEIPLSPVGEAVVEASREVLDWIAGKKDDFTEKSHTFLPGETISKQLLILNDTRHIQTVEWSWSVPEWHISDRGRTVIMPGSRKNIPFSFHVPPETESGGRKILAEFHFANGMSLKDCFEFNIVSFPKRAPKGVIGVFDPENTLIPLLKRLNLSFVEVKHQSALNRIDLLLMGRFSLNYSKFQLSPLVSKGLNILVMEQSYETLTRLGFRGNIHGLREVFSPLGKSIRDWRGSSTLTSPFLSLDSPFTSYPKWNWNGFSCTRVWRAGNRGNVNSVLLEKPPAGNFLPLYHGGFDLQYAPALEVRSGKGRIIFSQFDICGRTEQEPEALNLLHALIMRLDQKTEAAEKRTVYSGGAEGRSLLNSLQVKFSESENVSHEDLLILSSGAISRNLIKQVRDGLCVVALGLSGSELNSFFPGVFQTKRGSFYSDFITGLRSVPEFDGITNAELHWRNRLTADLFPESENGGRALAFRRLGKGCVVAIQAVPWKFDPAELQFRTTRRRCAFLVSRILFNLNAASANSLIKRLDFGFEGDFRYRLPAMWKGKADPEKIGRKAGWFRMDLKMDKSWRPVKVPGAFDLQFRELKNYDGLFWYRLDFMLPEHALRTRQIVFNLGQVDDESWVWINGKFVGELTQKTNPQNYWGAERRYVLKSQDFRKGRNTIVVLCNDLRNTGGIFGFPEVVALPDSSLYADVPENSDDPYRYYRW